MEDSKYLECRCSSPEHTLRFFFDDDPEFPCVYAAVFLANDPWHRRVLTGLKYILGYKCKYGHFDEFMLKPEDCDSLIEIASLMKKKSRVRTKPKRNSARR
jgi:hypothetical protein